MTVTQAEYANAKEMLERVQRLPRENQQAIMKMLTGAVVISEMYRDTSNDGRPKTERPGA